MGKTAPQRVVGALLLYGESAQVRLGWTKSNRPKFDFVAVNDPVTGLPVTAMGAARTTNSYLRERYRLAARLGKQRAIVAIEHSLVTAIWHMHIDNVDYHELGPDHFTRREPAHVMRRITKQANPLGFTVRFDPAPQTAGAA